METCDSGRCYFTFLFTIIVSFVECHIQVQVKLVMDGIPVAELME